MLWIARVEHHLIVANSFMRAMTYAIGTAGEFTGQVGLLMPQAILAEICPGDQILNDYLHIEPFSINRVKPPGIAPVLPTFAPVMMANKKRSSLFWVKADAMGSDMAPVVIPVADCATQLLAVFGVESLDSERFMGARNRPATVLPPLKHGEDCGPFNRDLHLRASLFPFYSQT